MFDFSLYCILDWQENRNVKQRYRRRMLLLVRRVAELYELNESEIRGDRKYEPLPEAKQLLSYVCSELGMTEHGISHTYRSAYY